MISILFASPPLVVVSSFRFAFVLLFSIDWIHFTVVGIKLVSLCWRQGISIFGTLSSTSWNNASAPRVSSCRYLYTSRKLRTINPNTPTFCNCNISHNRDSAPFARDTNLRCGRIDAIKGKWAYKWLDVVSPLATKTTFIWFVAFSRISLSRCSVVGLKPIVIPVSRECWSVVRAAFPRFLFRGLTTECWVRWEAKGVSRLI